MIPYVLIGIILFNLTGYVSECKFDILKKDFIVSDVKLDLKIV